MSGRVRAWWVTLRYGSPLTRAGRALRRNLRDPLTEYVECEAPMIDWAPNGTWIDTERNEDQ